MSQSKTSQCAAKYNCDVAGESIWGTKEQIQAFGIAIGQAFPGEPSGPKRQLSVRDPRGFKVKITRTYWRGQPFAADITYPNLPVRSKPPESEPFPGVRKREGDFGGCDEFRGKAEDLIAAGLVLATQLPGAPGMRKTRVTILADGSVLEGYYSNTIPAAISAGAKSVERASPKSATFLVSVHVDRAERDRRESRQEIARSAWLHEVRKLPRPRKLTPCFEVAVAEQASAAETAKRDATFQSLLGKLIQLSTGAAS